MNFDFSDDLKAAARAGAEIPARALSLDGGAARSWRGRSPTTRRCGRRSRPWAGPARRSRRSTAAPASAISGCACWRRSWARRWRRCRSRPRSISPARPSSPAAARRRRRPGCRSWRRGEAIGTLALAEGPGQGRCAQAAHDLPRRHAQRREAARARRRRGRRRHRRRAGRARRRRSRSSICTAPASRATAVETIDPSRSHARIAFDGAPAEPLGAPGDGERLLRRVQDRAAVLFAFEQVGGAQTALEMARDYALRALRVRPAHRLVPGDQAQARRHLRRHRAGALERLLRRLGAGARRAGAADGRRRRPHLGQRGLSSWRPRRTSRCTAAWASPGSSTATSTTAAPSCSSLALGSTRLWKDRLITQLETANAPR